MFFFVVAIIIKALVSVCLCILSDIICFKCCYKFDFFEVIRLNYVRLVKLFNVKTRVARFGRHVKYD